jgi:hypothetical protein
MKSFASFGDKLFSRVLDVPKHHLAVKGTLQPDWICMKMLSLDRPWLEHQPL